MILVQICLVIVLAGPLVWGWRNWIKYRGISAPKANVGYSTMINSAVLYALAFNMIFFLQELFLVLGKKAIGLKAFLYHNNHEWVGAHHMTSLMQGSGALAIFLIGLICLVIFRLIPYSSSIWKLFFLWLAFHGLIQSMPQVMVAYFDPGTDVGEALVGYLDLSQPILICLAITSMAATVFISIWFGRHLLGFVPTEFDLSDPKAKFRFIRFIAVGAALAGSILVIPFRILPMNQAITPFVVLVFSIPWTWSAAAIGHPDLSNSDGLKEKIHLLPIVFLVVLLIFFRLVLAPGLEF